jgi:LacI family transcriptional regulator
MTASMKDVAQRAEVSTATVSHVINRTRFVSEETRARVLQAMRELDYYPNLAARSLRSQRSNIVGLIVPDVANHFFMTLIKGVEDVLRANRYTLLVSNSDDDVDVEKEQLRILKAQLVDGLIMATTGHDHAFLEAALKDWPTVFVDREPNGYAKGDRVLVDNIGGTCEAMKALFERGHRQIGVILGLEGLTSTEERLAGYEKALANMGIGFDPALVRWGDSRPGSGYQLTRELVEATDMTALFIGNNAMAIGAMQFLRDREIRIPEELALICFDDSDWFLITDPPLSVVSQPSFEVGKHAAELLLRRLKGEDSAKPQRYRLPTKVILRESV